MKIKKSIILWILLTSQVWADDVLPVPVPVLNIHSAEPKSPNNVNVLPEKQDRPSERVLSVDEKGLLENTELLSRAMYSAVVANNVAGIKVVLPIYEKWANHDVQLARYARGLLAQADGKVGEAITQYRAFIAKNPDAPMVRWQLARALFEDKQNEAAADQFDRLQSESLPDSALRQVELYRKALREQDSWKFNAGLNVTREQNINQAPRLRQMGGQLSEEGCFRARLLNPDDDCFRGWKFNDPIDATAINYQMAAEKKWSWSDGWYATGGGNIYGKLYPSYTQFNDLNMRFSVGIGHANQRNDMGVEPFHERRFYGNDAYSYSNGVRLYWNRWYTPKIQMLSAIEFGRLKNQQRENSNNQNRLLSGSWVYYPNARQYWLLGGDVYQERNEADSSESFHRYGLRGVWGQEWSGGLSTRLQLSGAKRYYDGASFFSNGDQREDKELSGAISVWHRAIHFKGMTPRVTLSHHKTMSNDPFYEYGKSRFFIEVGKTF